MAELGLGFHVRRIIVGPDGSRKDEGAVFPQGYNFTKDGMALPYPTLEEARAAKRQILQEGLPGGRILKIYSVTPVEQD